MNRHQLKVLLRDGNTSSGSQNFRVKLPPKEVPAALNILNHLQAAGQFSSFSRRDAQESCGGCGSDCGCIMIYGYTG